MKKIIVFISVFFCFNFSIEAQNDISNQSKLEPLNAVSIHSDSLNQVDETGRKQGYWKVKMLVDNKWVLKEEGNYLNNRKSGYWIEYYASGKIKNKLFFADGRVNGYCEMYYENGSIVEKGTFAKNKYIGEYALYYQSGQMQHKFNFNEKGKREGKQYFYYESGIIAIEGDFVNGQETHLIEYYESGKTKEKKIGDSLKIKFYENGVCKSVEHYISKKQESDLFVGISDEGKPAHHISEKNDVRNGYQFYYNMNGYLYRKLHYVSGKKDGPFYYYHPNGTVKFFGEYKDDHLIGQRKYYDESGKLIKGQFKFYHPNGKVEREGMCIDGKPEGVILVYNEDGKILLSAPHINGKPDGKLIYYNNEGEPYLEEEYKDGAFQYSKTHEYIK